MSYRFTIDQYMLSFYEGVGVTVLKIEESESEILCTDFTALTFKLWK
jgi:hypothetical protein